MNTLGSAFGFCRGHHAWQSRGKRRASHNVSNQESKLGFPFWSHLNPHVKLLRLTWARFEPQEAYSELLGWRGGIFFYLIGLWDPITVRYPQRLLTTLVKMASEKPQAAVSCRCSQPYAGFPLRCIQPGRSMQVPPCTVARAHLQE